LTWGGTRRTGGESGACRLRRTRSNLYAGSKPSMGSGKGKASVHPVLAEIFGVDGVIVLIVIVVVLFGGSQIPKLARSLGSAQSQFKKGLEEGKSEATDTDKATSADGDGTGAAKG
jgi:sec-independent protein translocase protein TatA